MCRNIFVPYSGTQCFIPDTSSFHDQWRIQDFPDGGEANPGKFDENPLCGKIFAKKLHGNVRNWTERAHLGFANDDHIWSHIELFNLR